MAFATPLSSMSIVDVLSRLLQYMALRSLHFLRSPRSHFFFLVFPLFSAGCRSAQPLTHFHWLPTALTIRPRQDTFPSRQPALRRRKEREREVKGKRAAGTHLRWYSCGALFNVKSLLCLVFSSSLLYTGHQLPIFLFSFFFSVCLLIFSVCPVVC